MKNFKFYLLLFSFFACSLYMYSCFNSVSTRGEKTELVQQSKDNNDYLLQKSGSDYTVFYNRSEKKFYFIQHTSPIPLAPKMRVIGFTDKSLTFRNIESEETFSYALDVKGVYGITTLKGLENNVFSDVANHQWLEGDISEKVFCRCIQQTHNITNNCQSGGIGSTSCAQKFKFGQMSTECEARCGEGTYACCWPKETDF